jgi:hypothetical protein
VADEANQVPGVLLAVRLAERGHAGEADAVLDDVEQLAVAQQLRALGAQVGRFRVEALANGRLAAAVVAVAESAVVGEVLEARRQRRGIVGRRVSPGLRIRRSR